MLLTQEAVECLPFFAVPSMKLLTQRLAFNPSARFLMKLIYVLTRVVCVKHFFSNFLTLFL